MQPSEAVTGIVRNAFGPALGDPVLLAAVAVVVGIVGLGAWLVLRRSRRSAGTAVQRALGRHDRVTLLLHPNPDPDAMAAAMGLAELATEAGTETDICYPGEIRHHENRAFRTVLELDATSIDRRSQLSDAVVLVDHNEARGFQGAGDVDPIAVIDHHPGDGEGQSFTDVRPAYGACATIVVEYLQERGFDLAGEDDPALSEATATGLLYGIFADTSHLTRGPTAAEFAASAALYPGVDEDLLDRVANPSVDAEVLETKARAIENRTVRAPFVVSRVGDLSNVDAIPQAADELLHLEGSTAVVVMGRKNGTLHLSGRSRDDRVHMGQTLATVVEDIPMASAGGHARMGGGQLSVEHMEGLGPSAGVSETDLTERLFAAMAGEE